MTWNYRVMKCNKQNDLEESYGIFEVHYDDAGKVVGWTSKPVIVGDSLKELQQVITKLMASVTIAKEYPSMILREEDLEKSCAV